MFVRKWFTVLRLLIVTSGFFLVLMGLHISSQHRRTGNDADRAALQAPPGSKLPIIPRIIHQTWDTFDIPIDLVPWVKTWRTRNPDWEYWFWTPTEVRQLLLQKYPKYLKLYNSYRYNIFRSDIMRYFIMDSFGGFYADLDMDCLKPLEPWIFRHRCLLTYEPHQHPYFGFNRSKPNVMTTIVASHPGHQYWKTLIKALPGAYRDHMDDVQLSTGPLFMDEHLQRYNESQSGSLTVISSLDQVTSQLSDSRSITILQPKYFLPTYDPLLEAQIRAGCKTLKTLDQNLLDVCDRMRLNATNAPGANAFTNHHWVHMFLAETKWQQKETRSIFDIIPDAKVYTPDSKSPIYDSRG